MSEKLVRLEQDYQIMRGQLAGIEIVAAHCMSQFFGRRRIDIPQTTEEKLKRICGINMTRHAIVSS